MNYMFQTESEINEMLLGTAGFTLIPAKPTGDKWCAVYPGGIAPLQEGKRRNYLGWFNSPQEAARVVVEDVIARPACDELHIHSCDWSRLGIKEKIKAVRLAGQAGHFTPAERFIDCGPILLQ